MYSVLYTCCMIITSHAFTYKWMKRRLFIAAQDRPSCCASTGFVYGNPHFRPPPSTESTPLADRQKLSQVIKPASLHGLHQYKIWCKSVHGGAYGHIGETETAWWRKRRGLAQGCVFLRFRWHCIPPAPTIQVLQARYPSCRQTINSVKALKGTILLYSIKVMFL